MHHNRDFPTTSRTFHLMHPLERLFHLVLQPNIVLVAKHIIIGINTLKHPKEIVLGPMPTLVLHHDYVAMLCGIFTDYAASAVCRTIVMYIKYPVFICLAIKRIYLLLQIPFSVICSKQYCQLPFHNIIFIFREAI